MVVLTPPPPFPTSLCHGCRHLRSQAARASVFMRCAHPAVGKYPRQPVLACRARESDA
jgi:hypothetical protein